MLAFALLALLILIIILIMYSFYFIQPHEVKLLSERSIQIVKKNNNKMISHFTEYLEIDSNKVYIAYYDLPLNCVYWSIGTYKNGTCLNSINMGKYQTAEDGDSIAIIIGNNKRAMKMGKRKIKEEHESKYSYKKLIFDYLQVNEPFYIHYEAFSNEFTSAPKLILKEYIFDSLPIEEPDKIKIDKSLDRDCEQYNLFEHTKEGFITEKCKRVNVTIDTNENDIPFECVTNRSDVIDISDCDKSKPCFRIIGVDHFKSRAALHSHIVCFDADTNKQLKIQITGEITNEINHEKTITVRRITFKLPHNINRIYFIEYIYYDFVTGNKINPGTIIPMEVYKVEH